MTRLNVYNNDSFRRVAGAPDVGRSAITQKVTENSAQGVWGIVRLIPIADDLLSSVH